MTRQFTSIDLTLGKCILCNKKCNEEDYYHISCVDEHIEILKKKRQEDVR